MPAMVVSGTAVQVRHIVWDWNGTLLDDNEAVLAAVNSVCAAFGREPVTLDEWRGMFRRPIRHSYQDLLGRELDAAEWALLDRQYHDAYRELLHTCGLAEDGMRALRAWQRDGRSQSLLSMWFHEELLPLVSEFGLDEFFTRVDGLRHETGGGSKAEHLLEHLEAAGVEPGAVALIGDVTDDAVAAREAGAHCVLVSTGMASRDALVKTGVPVADSISGALRLL
jgi:phosphoglycolate phosphatase-like HAD superfamily hydrolase